MRRREQGVACAERWRAEAPAGRKQGHAHLVLSYIDGPIGARVLAEALAEAALPVPLVHVAQLAIGELAMPTHPILNPLALVLVAVFTAILAVPVVHAIEPLTVVRVAARKRVRPLTRPFVVHPLPVELVTNLVRVRLRVRVRIRVTLTLTLTLTPTLTPTLTLTLTLTNLVGHRALTMPCQPR